MSAELSSFLFELVAYGGGSVALAFIIFRYLGTSWIENKFAQKLELFRHEQAKELERLKLDIDSVLSGKIKLQEKEFETLPKVWELLDTAYGAVTNLVSSFFKMPNLNEMSVERLNEYLESTEFKETFKNDIRQAPDKNQEFQSINFLYQLRDVKASCSDFHNYVVREGIFFPKPLKDKLTKVTEALWSATASKEVGKQYDNYRWEIDGFDKVQKEIKPLYFEIEGEIHRRLQIHGHSKHKTHDDYYG